MQFCMYPIERTATKFPLGMDDDDFDVTLLPMNLIEGAQIEDVSSLITDDEFAAFKQELGTRAVEKLEKIKYVIIHRFSDNDVQDGKFVSGPELLQQSQNIVAELAACLRLIRPTAQHTRMCWGA
jgi:hypothetical protein